MSAYAIGESAGRVIPSRLPRRCRRVKDGAHRQFRILRSTLRRRRFELALLREIKQWSEEEA